MFPVTHFLVCSHSCRFSVQCLKRRGCPNIVSSFWVSDYSPDCLKICHVWILLILSCFINLGHRFFNFLLLLSVPWKSCSKLLLLPKSNRNAKIWLSRSTDKNGMGYFGSDVSLHVVFSCCNFLLNYNCANSVFGWRQSPVSVYIRIRNGTSWCDFNCLNCWIFKLKPSIIPLINNNNILFLSLLLCREYFVCFRSLSQFCFNGPQMWKWKSPGVNLVF